MDNNKVPLRAEHAAVMAVAAFAPEIANAVAVNAFKTRGPILLPDQKFWPRMAATAAAYVWIDQARHMGTVAAKPARDLAVD